MTGLDLESFLKDVLAQKTAVEKIEEAKVVEPPPPAPTEAEEKPPETT